MTAAMIERLAIWSVYYGVQKNEHGNITYLPRVGAQRFKTKACAEEGVNVLESGYVLGFAQLNSDTDEVLKVEFLPEPIKTGMYYAVRNQVPLRD